MTRGTALAALVALAACTRPQPSRPPVAAAATSVPSSKRSPRPPPPPGSFWELVEIDLGATPGITVPLTDKSIARVEGATRLWDEIGEEARARVRASGVVVLGAGPIPPSSGTVGDFYMALREQRLPYVVTIDALFIAVHAVLERALAEVEEDCVEPALDTFLARVGSRLDVDRTIAGADLAPAYRTARGVIAVARAFLGYAPPADLADAVRTERTRIESRAATAPSAVVGVPIDYGRFVVPSSASKPGMYRALAWLASAPLAVAAKSEEQGSVIDVTTARTNARAAMLLARLVDRDVDPIGHETYARVSRILAFLWGAPDDVSLGEIVGVASSAGLDIARTEDIANVVRVDRVRAKMRAGHAPALWDGGIPAGRAGLSVRVFGGNAAADSVVLASFTGPRVGRAREDAPKDRVRFGTRALPSALDLAAWLGSPQARPVLREAKLDAFDAYDATLTKVLTTRPDSEATALHASVHGSLVDALLAWAASETPPTPGPLAARVRVESLLGSWTLVRHLAQPLGRPRASRPVQPRELKVRGAALPSFIEAEPHVIARLLAIVRQTQKGLSTLGPLPAKSPAQSALAELEDVLWLAMRVSSRAAADKPLQAEDEALLASLPARLANLEADAPDEPGPVLVPVHADPISGVMLVSATGAIEPVLQVVREPGTSRSILAVGAHTTHREMVERTRGGMEPTDGAWRARLKAEPPPPSSWTASFRAAR